jgi:hydroxymethylglutaryl-CoA lyase
MIDLVPAAGTSVTVVEVGPRDGLQNEPTVLSVAERADFVRSLAAAGLERIEAGSFVNPKWVPAMADSAAVFEALADLTGPRPSALTPNLHGVSDALAAGVDELAMFLSASETHSQKNINASIDEALQRARSVAAAGRAGGARVRGYVSVIFGCPYEGAVPVERVVELTQELLTFGCYEVSLGDTIGVGTPREVSALIIALEDAQVDLGRIALHLHDTRGTALVNVLIGLQMGVRTFDAAAGGLGGCPYAPGASGNLATEDLVYLFDGLGLSHGVDLGLLMDATETVCAALGRAPNSRVYAAQRGVG